MFTQIIQLILKLVGGNPKEKKEQGTSVRNMDIENRFGNDTVVVKGQPTPEFKYGMNHAWIMFQLAMFKMYREDELLDYDSLFEEVSKNVEKISGDVGELKKWNEDYIEYLQSKDQFDEPNVEDL